MTIYFIPASFASLAQHAALKFALARQVVVQRADIEGEHRKMFGIESGIDPLRVHVSANPPHKRVDVDVETRLALTRLAFPEDTVLRDEEPYSIDTVTGFLGSTL